jgi:hypothetical protein
MYVAIENIGETELIMETGIFLFNTSFFKRERPTAAKNTHYLAFFTDSQTQH